MPCRLSLSQTTYGKKVYSYSGKSSHVKVTHLSLFAIHATCCCQLMRILGLAMAGHMLHSVCVSVTSKAMIHWLRGRFLDRGVGLQAGAGQHGADPHPTEDHQQIRDDEAGP